MTDTPLSPEDFATLMRNYIRENVRIRVSACGHEGTVTVTLLVEDEEVSHDYFYCPEVTSKE